MVETIKSANLKRKSQVLLNGAQEILGNEAVQKVFEQISHGDHPRANRHLHGMRLREAGPFLRALEEIYGGPSGHGLALRIGQASFRYGLKSFDELAGLRTTEFRLLPSPRRLVNGLHTLAQFIGNQYDCQITVLDKGDYWSWHIHYMPEGQVQESAGLDCFLIAGVLQEFTFWAGGGRFYQVVETECRASGCLDCIYRIGKKPLD